MKATLILTMDQQSMASFKVNSGCQRSGQLRHELSMEQTSNDLDTFKTVDMGK